LTPFVRRRSRARITIPVSRHSELDPNLPTPLHQQLAQRLRHQITSGVWSEGDAISSEHELCKTWRVSRVTVRKALETLAQQGLIIRRTGSGTFVQETTARRGMPANQVQLIITNVLGTNTASILHGVEEAVEKASMELMVRISRDDLELERKFLEDALKKMPTAVVLYNVAPPTEIQPNCYHYLSLREAGIPAIMVDRYIPQLPIGHVTVDNAGSMRQLTEHLIGTDRKRITYLRSHGVSSADTERYSGFFEAVVGHALQPLKVVRVGPRGENGTDITAGQETVKSMLKDGVKPDAIVGANTYLALGAIRALLKAGLRVPEDVAVVGFEDIPEAATNEVPVTAMRLPLDRVGALAAEAAIEHGRAGKADTSDVRHYLTGELIVRRSCGGTPNQTATPPSPVPQPAAGVAAAAR
jgi:DNA-binding LacI/PurR family transcriptional regulator